MPNTPTLVSAATPRRLVLDTGAYAACCRWISKAASGFAKPTKPTERPAGEALQPASLDMQTRAEARRQTALIVSREVQAAEVASLKRRSRCKAASISEARLRDMTTQILRRD
jgi:hypothetical protein